MGNKEENITIKKGQKFTVSLESNRTGRCFTKGAGINPLRRKRRSLSMSHNIRIHAGISKKMRSQIFDLAYDSDSPKIIRETFINKVCVRKGKVSIHPPTCAPRIPDNKPILRIIISNC